MKKMFMGLFWMAALALGQIVFAQDVTNGLIARWTFDDGKGTGAADSSGGKTSLSLKGKPAAVEGKLGKALSFDGKADYAEAALPKMDFNRDFSLCFWVRPAPDAAKPGVLFSTIRDENNWRGFAVLYEPAEKALNVVRFKEVNTYQVNTFSKFYESKANDVLTSGAWQHVVVAADFANNMLLIYKDGVLLGTYSNADVKEINWNARDGLVRIAAEDVGGKEPLSFAGAIDDVRLYDRLLSDEEITRIFKAEK